MDQKAGSLDYLRRLTVNLPESVLIEVDEAILEMRKQGQRVSFSGMVEIALRELLERNNVASILRKYHAAARRSKLDGKPKTI